MVLLVRSNDTTNMSLVGAVGGSAHGDGVDLSDSLVDEGGHLGIANSRGTYLIGSLIVHGGQPAQPQGRDLRGIELPVPAGVLDPAVTA